MDLAPLDRHIELLQSLDFAVRFTELRDVEYRAQERGFLEDGGRYDLLQTSTLFGVAKGYSRQSLE